MATGTPRLDQLLSERLHPIPATGDSVLATAAAPLSEHAPRVSTVPLTSAEKAFGAASPEGDEDEVSDARQGAARARQRRRRRCACARRANGFTPSLSAWEPLLPVRSC